MDFISNKEVQIAEMLASLGLKSIEDLFSTIPDSIKLPKPSQDDGLSEYEGMLLMESLAAKNSFPQFDNYLGGGAYQHHVPAIVNAICSKSEFLTSYTPYQAEVSQGMLQAIFEFQSSICALTGLDISNASLYDGATACAEASLMALRMNKGRNQVVIASSMNPHYREVIQQYLNSHGTKIDFIPFDEHGQLDEKMASKVINDKTAAVLLQYPNFFGVVDDIKLAVSLAKSHGALSILCANPLVYGLYSSAGDLNVDIAVGDTQPFGLPLQFGGPYAGYIACRQDLVRQLPGRIVGETIDIDGKRGFVLTLQAREQHIRREKATSNICTNQALAALASLIAMLWYGKEGVKKLSLMNFQRASYLKTQLASMPGVKTMGDAPIFNEFAISFNRPFSEVETFFRQHGIAVGVDLGIYYSHLKDMVLICVTETKSKEQLDRFVQVAKDLLARPSKA